MKRTVLTEQHNEQPKERVCRQLENHHKIDGRR